MRLNIIAKVGPQRRTNLLYQDLRIRKELNKGRGELVCDTTLSNTHLNHAAVTTRPLPPPASLDKIMFTVSAMLMMPIEDICVFRTSSCSELS